MERSSSPADAVLLQSGTVLIAGGQTGAGGGGTDFAELYTDGTFSCPGINCFGGRAGMTVARTGHAAALLPNGQVALFGGVNNAGSATAAIEMLDPSGTVNPRTS